MGWNKSVHEIELRESAYEIWEKLHYSQTAHKIVSLSYNRSKINSISSPEKYRKKEGFNSWIA